MDVVHPARGAYKAALSKLTDDLQGRKLKCENGNLKGIYIIDGKKALIN